MLSRTSIRHIFLPATAALALGAGAVAFAHDGDEPTGGIQTHDYKPPAVVSLATSLLGTDGKPIANVQLHQDAAGVVLVILDASTLPAGPHGIHIHGVGVCEGPAFTTAGAHFNPTSVKHGTGGPHAGDLPQIDATTVVQGYYTATTKAVSLTGGANALADADGSAIIVHAAADDGTTDPTGNSGARIGCAVLAAPKPVVPTATPKPPATGTGIISDDGGFPVTPALGLAIVATAAAGAAFWATRRKA